MQQLQTLLYIYTKGSRLCSGETFKFFQVCISMDTYDSQGDHRVLEVEAYQSVRGCCARHWRLSSLKCCQSPPRECLQTKESLSVSKLRCRARKNAWCTYTTMPRLHQTQDASTCHRTYADVKDLQPAVLLLARVVIVTLDSIWQQAPQEHPP